MSYATSGLAVEKDSCGPGLKAMLLAAQLLNEFIVNSPVSYQVSCELACYLCY